MIQGLQTRMIESQNPVGIKKTSNWKLPKSDFTYGLAGKTDIEDASIITRTWKTHRPTSQKEPAMDYVRINKLAVKMNATNFGTHKDFRKTVDIRQNIKQGKKKQDIYLPPSDFTYGVPNRTPTPIKEVINGEYGNRAENNIEREYNHYIQEQRDLKNRMKKPPKVVTRYINPKVEIIKEREKEKMRNDNIDYDPLDEELPPENMQPLWKMKMFQGAKSKVAEGVKQFKTYQPYKKRDNIDKMIDNVEEEIRQNNMMKQQKMQQQEVQGGY